MAQNGTENNLIGRTAELAAVDSAVESLQRGQGRVLLLAGEPGIGKSTLARRIDDIATAANIRVSWGFAWEAGGAPAYWLWTQLLRSLLKTESPDSKLTAALGQVLPEYSNASEEALHLQPEQARFQLFEAVRALLEEASRKHPQVLMLEDLHAADNDSLHLLHYVSRHIRSMPILLVGTFRDIEARQSPLSEMLWRTARDAQVLQLSRLSGEEVSEFVSRETGAEPELDQVNQLLATTEGNPLFLTELVGLLEQDGAIDEGQLPESVQQVIHQQHKRLSTDTARLLGTASVLGRQFSNSALAELSGQSYAQVCEALLPAINAGVINEVSQEKYRFAHVLHRDVLHQGMDRILREALHLKHAKYLRSRIDRGEVDRWSELANHLNMAGPDHRYEAVDAWRNAAARASQRFAFEDAANSLRKALESFGEGPRFAPADRSQLMLDLASAALAKGDIEQGRALCLDAFELAKTIEDPQLMARSTLTYGSIIVVAKVDQQLIALLRESIDLLPEDDVDTRARMLARLAAALQPSPTPAEPVQMARDAIALARTTSDERVVYDVLNSAISAMMDFTPPAERIELNREVEKLAAKFGDVPSQFRSNLRLMIDASELGDRRMMDEVIDACDQIAGKIKLPHYTWRVASARAMQATIEGNFAKATQWLEKAQALVERIDDESANLTLAIQHFTILYDWASPRAVGLDEIQKRLQKAYDNGLEAAEFFVRPLIAAYEQYGDRNVARAMISNEALVTRVFSGGDRFTLSAVGKMALVAEDTALIQRVYSELLADETLCSTLGLMGTCWGEPVAYNLGLLASGLGQDKDARRFFDLALVISERMRARPLVARICISVASLAEKQKDDEAARRFNDRAQHIIEELEMRPDRSVSTVSPGEDEAVTTADNGFSMRHEGDVWKVGFGGQSVLVKDSKGLRLLEQLVSEPDKDLHVLELVGSHTDADNSSAVPALDDQARRDYRQRIGDIEEELSEAESFADSARVDSLRSELDFITAELSRAFGLGGRQRQTGSAAERARVNVRRRLSDTIKRIDKQLPEAGRYLKNTIKTGSYCRYTPM